MPLQPAAVFKYLYRLVNHLKNVESQCSSCPPHFQQVISYFMNLLGRVKLQLAYISSAVANLLTQYTYKRKNVVICPSEIISSF